MTSPATELAAVSVPATTANLGPGFDAFGAALGLRLTASAWDPTDGADRVTTVDGHGVPVTDVPGGDDNLVWQAVLAACDHFGWQQPDVGLRVETPIPLARGLGSSSAAIVGGIALARVLAGADPSVRVAAHAVGDRDLVALAAGLEGHPDNVAPAVHGGLVACATTDGGDLVTRIALPPAGTRPVLLVPPGTSLTAQTRAVLPDTLSRADVVAQAGRAGHVLAGLTGSWPVDPRLAGDRLHEPVRAAALPAGGPLLDRLRAGGAHAWLSGAGPSICVAVPVRDRELLDEVRGAAGAAGHEVLELDWDHQGIRACVPDGCGVSGRPGCTDCPLPSLR